MDEPSLFLKAPEAPLPPAPRRFKFSPRAIGSVFGFLILTVGLGFGLLQVQRNQEIQKSSASSQGAWGNGYCSGNGCGSHGGCYVNHWTCNGTNVSQCTANDSNINPNTGLGSASFSKDCGTEQIDIVCSGANVLWCPNRPAPYTDTYRGYTDAATCKSPGNNIADCPQDCVSAPTAKTVGYVWKFYDNACGTQTTPKYMCSGNSCIRDDVNGTLTDSNCNNSCTQQTTPKYKCSSNSCVRDDANGGYLNSNCDNACSTPAPTCNNTGVSLSISPNQARSGEMVTFQVSGDASTYLEDLFPIGGVINYPSDAVARAVSFIGTVSGTPGQTYRWTRRWKHCVDNFQNCSQVCEASANFNVLANPTPIPTNTPTPSPTPSPTPTPTPTGVACLATYTQLSDGIQFVSSNPFVTFKFVPVGSAWQLTNAGGVDLNTNTTPALGTNHNPGRLDISFIHQGTTKSVCITLPPVPTATPSPTPTPTPMAMCQNVKIYRGTPLVEIAASDIQQGNSITFRAFANATNVTLSTIRFSVRIGSAAPTTYDRTASLVGGVYQADLQLDITQAATYIVSAVPILP